MVSSLWLGSFVAENCFCGGEVGYICFIRLYTTPVVARSLARAGGRAVGIVWWSSSILIAGVFADGGVWELAGLAVAAYTGVVGKYSASIKYRLNPSKTYPFFPRVPRSSI